MNIYFLEANVKNMQKLVVSFVISLVFAIVFNMNCKKDDTDVNQKMLAISVTSFALSYFAQTLLINNTSFSMNGGGIDTDVKRMMENVQIGESPF